ncbi:hypothetical protein BUALT_Bualt07G0146900 [Buddleja alternifolia]|uniref:Phytocyanin domain-containing protein n=1 Tax=Buddleja alternifolia TaxID=168488 RepID=A0AAV6XLI0_9LAMI|nr:hypothetical protein BUALT_Bualt07G0146900 [Buddleja alternifolia]
MAFSMGCCFATLFIPIIITSFAPAVMAAEEFKVGGNEGWRQPAANETEMYNRWAERRRFHIGDSLRFEYKNDTVLVVDKWGYYHCDSSHPISVFKDENTVIKLDRPGPIYFVSGEPDHCKNGQRLMVEVITLHPISKSPPSLAPSPSSSAGSFSFVPELLSLYVLLFAASVHM